MFIPLMIMVCGLAIIVVDNLRTYILFKKRLSPYAPSISKFFAQLRLQDLIIFSLLSVNIIVLTFIDNFEYPKNLSSILNGFSWPVIIYLCSLTVLSIVFFHQKNMYSKNLKEIESYCYTHQATKLQYQAKIDYERNHLLVRIFTLIWTVAWGVGFYICKFFIENAVFWIFSIQFFGKAAFFLLVF